MRTLDFTLASALRQMLNDADLGHAEFADAIDIRQVQHVLGHHSLSLASDIG